MLSFMTSQAIALSQVKQVPDKSLESGQENAARPAHKGFWSRLHDAMIDSRLRQAEIELRYYRALHEKDSNK